MKRTDVINVVLDCVIPYIDDPKDCDVVSLCYLAPFVDKDAFAAPSTSVIGDVQISHNVVLHGCIIDNEAFVGMGTTLLGVVV
ncbi:hypothetical protein RJT34_23359 [Clitoria ternatea]|uniref:COI1 F-box domain-containing protein n=1 Tax=Clitoria ternatea TaxID=43366 RepID=A0AAN9FNQ2_CLITE